MAKCIIKTKPKTNSSLKRRRIRITSNGKVMGAIGYKKHFLTNKSRRFRLKHGCVERSQTEKIMLLKLINRG